MKNKPFFLVILILVILTTLSACEGKTLSFSSTQFNIAIGEEYALPLVVTPKNASYTLTSSDPSVVEIVGKKILGKKEGTATVTATSGDLTATLEVIVRGKIVNQKIDVKFQIDNEVLFTKTLKPSAELKSSDVDLVVDQVPAGYWFDNTWYLDEDCTSKLTFPYKLGDSDTTFYSRYILSDGTDSDHPLPLNVDGTLTSVATGLMYPDLPYENIVFPEDITSVKESAFKGNTTIKSIDFNCVTSIGKSAFENCSALEEIKIKTGEEGVKTLGDYAFKNSTLARISTYEDNLYSLKLSTVGTDVFVGTAFQNSMSSSPYIRGDGIPRYKGFFLGKFMLGYNSTTLDSEFSSTFTFVADNTADIEICCTFSNLSTIKVVLLDYSTAKAEELKNKFIAKGILPSNITTGSL